MLIRMFYSCKLFIYLAVFGAGVLCCQGRATSLEDMTYTTEEYFPTNYMSDGEVQGLSVDILKLIWQNLALKEQNIYIYPWARAYRNMLNQDNLVLFSMARTPQRNDLFQWACPIETSRYALYALKVHKIKITSAEQLLSYHIGTVRSDGSEQVLRDELGSKILLSSNASMAANLNKAYQKRVDLIVYNQYAADKMFRHYGHDPADFEVVFSLKEMPSCFAFSKNIAPALVSQFQGALTKIVNSSRYQDLLTKTRNKRPY